MSLSTRIFTAIILMMVTAMTSFAQPWTYTPTDNNHTIIIPLSVAPSFRNIALDHGDYIGVFFEKDGIPTCGGYEMWNGTSNISVAAWGDDATTTGKDGFASGEKLQWRIYRHSDGREGVVGAIYAAAGGIATNTDGYASGGISLLTGFTDITYELRLEHGGLIGTNTYEFEISLRRLSTQPLELASLEPVLTFDPAISAGTLTASLVSGSSDLNAAQQPPGISIVNNEIRIAPAPVPASGAGTMIPTLSAVRIAKIRLVSSVPFAPYRANVAWKNSGSPPSTTVKCRINSSVHNVTSLTPAMDHLSLLENVVLPVELQSFTARTTGNAIELRWATASEKNNYGFDVERKNFDEWETIGFVGGHGTSNTKHEYSFIDRDMCNGSFVYRLKQIDRDGKYQYSLEVIETFASLPADYSLGQNYPNPFNPSASIQYTLPEASRISIRVYDITGRAVSTLIDAEQAAGYYTISLQGNALSSGIYYYRMTASHESKLYIQTRKMVLMR